MDRSETGLRDTGGPFEVDDPVSLVFPLRTKIMHTTRQP